MKNHKIHHSTRETESRAYDRLRKTGIPREAATQIAKQATREAHNILERKK